MRYLPVLVSLVCALPVHAATLRSSTTLQQSQVRVADLFDDAGAAAERVLGPGPAPGGRIVVETAQAAAIARQFGVAWHPNGSTERVVIDRPGRLVPREDVLSVLRAALLGAGAPEAADIALQGFNAPLVPMESTPQLAIEQVDLDSTASRFTADLAVSVPGEPTQRLRLSGRVQEMVEIVVPTHRLAVGTVIGPGDVQPSRVRAGQWRGDVAHTMAQAVGQAVRRMANPGQAIPMADLGRPMIVLKGAQVMMLLQSPGLSLAAMGQATEAGGLGDRIGVLNPVSGAVVEAEIIGADQVRVAPNSAPRLPARNAATQVSMR